jgi:hypothetical protein
MVAQVRAGKICHVRRPPVMLVPTRGSDDLVVSDDFLFFDCHDFGF